MKVIVSSLMIISLALLSLAVVEWLPRFSQPSAPVHAAGFAIYPEPLSGVANNAREGVEGSASGLSQLAREAIQAADRTEDLDVLQDEPSHESSQLLAEQVEPEPEPLEVPIVQEKRANKTQETQRQARIQPESSPKEPKPAPAPVIAQKQAIEWAGANTARARPAVEQMMRSRPAPVTRAPKRSVLAVQVVSAAHKSPVKANVYVQRENGVNVSSQRYVDRARFDLSPGRYKVTVRAKGHQDTVRTLHVGQHSTHQTFALHRHVSRPAPAVQTIANEQAKVRRQQQVQKQKQLQQQRQQEQQRIARRQQQVQHAAPRSVARPVQHPVPVQRAPVAPRTGRLQLHAVSATDGQPLAVNFRITSTQGKTLHHAPGVAYADMSVPVGQVRIHIQHQGLTGSEVARIQPGETTAHTFSVMPSTQVAAAHSTTQRRVLRPRLGLGVGIGPLVFRIR